MSKVNWEEVRANYPACGNGAYFSTAAVGPLHKSVFEARLEHLKMMHYQGDIHWQESVALLDVTRGKVAQLIEAQPEDIGFGYNTSHNMNGVAELISQLSSKKKIIAPAVEFPSTVTPWLNKEYKVDFVSAKNSVISISDILSKIDSETAAVVCSHIQFASGFKLNINQLGEELHKRGIAFIINATQSLGVSPVSVHKTKASAIMASCHKWMNGGYGCSVLYLNPELRKKTSWPFKGWLSVNDPGAMNPLATDFKTTTDVIETGVPAFNIMAGLDKAFDVVLDLGVNNIAERILRLSHYLQKELESAGIEILSARDDNHNIEETSCSGTISIKCKEPEQWVSELEKKNIFVSARSEGLRVAVSYFNNEQDLNQLISALKELRDFYSKENLNSNH